MLKRKNFFKFFILVVLLFFIAKIMKERLENYEAKNDFYLNPKWSICAANKSLLFIAFVVIAPHLFEQRSKIRNSWANKQFSSEIKLIFSVGLSPNRAINELIHNESALYSDILQINHFNDSYYNCTYKIMKTFKWIAKYCPHAKYVLKICDDVVVNTPQILNYFRHLPYEQNQIFGYGIYGVGPIRNVKNKWYVSKNEFNGTKYDPYVQGK